MKSKINNKCNWYRQLPLVANPSLVRCPFCSHLHWHLPKQTVTTFSRNVPKLGWGGPRQAVDRMHSAPSCLRWYNLKDKYPDYRKPTSQRLTRKEDQMHNQCRVTARHQEHTPTSPSSSPPALTALISGLPGTKQDKAHGRFRFHDGSWCPLFSCCLAKRPTQDRNG